MHSHTISDGKQEAINQSVRKMPETLIIAFNRNTPSMHVIVQTQYAYPL